MKNYFTLVSLTLFLCGTASFVSSRDPISQSFLSIIEELFWEQAHGEMEENVVSRINKIKFDETKESQDQFKAVILPTQDPALPHPKVQVKTGLLIGETVDQAHGFYSIPFGKPPVGPLRFMPPEPAEDFAELNVSVRTPRMCWQTKTCDADEPNCTALMSEDCLVLNVNVPVEVDLSDFDAPPSDRLPVLVWFYGGFFYEGRATTPKTDGRWLSEAANAVVVTVNYRVGSFGFLSFEDDIGFVEGNQGFKDQQLALQWVQDNIEKFGGDKTKVTLFGNSAGSQSILFHFASAVSKPLFARGIVQSSPTVFQYQTPEDSMNTITRRLLQGIGCENNFTCLRTIDPRALIDAKNQVSVQSLQANDWWGTIEPFRPVVGQGTEFSDQPLIMFKNGLWHTDKEIIIGNNDDEMSYIRELFGTIGIPLPKKIFEGINNKVVGEEYGQQINAKYTDSKLEVNFADNLAQEVTDMFFICPNRALARFAKQTSTHPSQRVYVYNLAYALTLENCVAAHDVSYFCGFPFHSSEVIFVFKSPQGYGTNFSAEDALVSDMFTTYWGGFAGTGDPSAGLTTSLGEFTTWPVYSNDSNPPWINIRLDYNQSTEEYRYRESYCDLWDESGFYFNHFYPIVSPTTSPINSTDGPSMTTKTNSVTTATTISTASSITTGLPQAEETTTNGAIATTKITQHNFTAYLLLALMYACIFSVG